MCGIIGYVGQRPCKELLLQGLERLEYRGYDSAGLALREDDGLDYVRAVGNLQFLKDAAGENGSQVDDRARSHALGDARRRHRAERPSADRLRRRPARDRAERDRRELPRAQGVARGRRAHVQHRDRRRGGRPPDRAPLRRATSSRPCAPRTGSSRATSPSSSSTTTTRASSSARASSARCSSASAQGEMFLASMAAAFISETRAIQLIEDGEIVAITEDGRALHRRRERRRRARGDRGRLGPRGAPRRAATRRSCSRRSTSSRRPSRETIGDRVRHGELVLESLGMTETELRNLRRIVIVACGHRVPRGRRRPLHDRGVGADPGRARHRQRVDLPQPGRSRKDTLVIGISQSGETRDTINAMQARPRARRAHARDHEPDGHADHARGRLGALHALRPRDRRRRLEDVHRAGRAARPDRAQARAGAQDAAAGRDRVHPRPSCYALPEKIAASSSTATIRSRRSPSASTTSRSSSTSAATSACRSRSRARSS